MYNIEFFVSSRFTVLVSSIFSPRVLCKLQAIIRWSNNVHDISWIIAPVGDSLISHSLILGTGKHQLDRLASSMSSRLMMPSILFPICGLSQNLHLLLVKWSRKYGCHSFHDGLPNVQATCIVASYRVHNFACAAGVYVCLFEMSRIIDSALQFFLSTLKLGVFASSWNCGEACHHWHSHCPLQPHPQVCL